MFLRSGLQRVMNEYLSASQESFAKHNLADFIRGDLRRELANLVGNDDRYLFKGSAGQGTWARGPWLSIFDKLVTTTAQDGYYPVYLFREDMEGVYLSLNQGMTEIKKIYKSDAKTTLRARSANYRALLGGAIANFPDYEIDLAPSSPGNDTAFYEAGNICAKYYGTNKLPDEQQLTADLVAMIDLYGSLTTAETGCEAVAISEGDEPAEQMQFEDATRFRMHKRIERNAALAKQVKKLLGCTCQVCGINFEERYGAIGKDYIEAHHLKPLASLKGQKIAMDPAKDFAVLCANCHRMIHRTGYVDDIVGFKRDHYLG